RYEEYEDYDDYEEDYRPDGMPSPMMPPQGMPGPMMPPQGMPGPMMPPQGMPGPMIRPQFSPGPIRQCRNRFAYIWLINGRNFWAWISDVQGRTIYGYRWTGNRWVYFQANVNQVFTFICIR
ncbi:MAG: hypothetical protein K0R50_4764, partial [Eubacterium sp.]|nr:hypothetical protein [Eubacterium sp.]